ncbi:MAG: hypothetical protein QM783_17005 [Phycisphaerales bacterium]
MRKRLIIVAVGGLLLAVLSALLPVVALPFLPRPTPVSVSGARHLMAPREYPDPNINWIYRWPGVTEDASIRGIGVYDSWHVTRIRAGWPLPILEGGSYSEIHSSHGEAASGTLHTINLKSWWSNDLKRHWQLPTGFAWGGLGLLGNWAIWSAAIGIFLLPRALRREMRRRRNQCLACGYPRPAADRCPECGAAAA